MMIKRILSIVFSILFFVSCIVTPVYAIDSDTESNIVTLTSDESGWSKHILGTVDFTNYTNIRFEMSSTDLQYGFNKFYINDTEYWLGGDRSSLSGTLDGNDTSFHFSDVSGQSDVTFAYEGNPTVTINFYGVSTVVVSDTDTEIELTPLNEIVVDNEILPDITEIVTNQPFYFIVKSGSNVNLYVAFGAIRYRFAESNNKLFLYCHSTENETNSTAYYIQFLYDGDNWVRQSKIVGSINLSYGTMLYSSVDLYYNDELYFAKNLEDFDFIVDTDVQNISVNGVDDETKGLLYYITSFLMFFAIVIVLYFVYKFFDMFFKL